MAEYLVQEDSITAIADAIRAKTGTTADLSLTSMVEAISGFSSKKVVTGSVSWTSGTNATYNPVIAHNLGEAPNFVCFVQTRNFTSYPSHEVVRIYNATDTPVDICAAYDYDIENIVSETPGTMTLNENTVTIGGRYFGAYYYIIGVI